MATWVIVRGNQNAAVVTEGPQISLPWQPRWQPPRQPSRRTLAGMSPRTPPRRGRRSSPPTVRPLPSRPPALTRNAARLLLALLVEAGRRQGESGLPDPPDETAWPEPHDAVRLLRPGEHRGSTGPGCHPRMAAQPRPGAHRASPRSSRRRVLRRRPIKIVALEAPSRGEPATRRNGPGRCMATSSA